MIPKEMREVLKVRCLARIEALHHHTDYVCIVDRHFVFLSNYLTHVRAKKQAPTTVRSIQRSDCFMGVKSVSWQLGMLLIYLTQCTVLQIHALAILLCMAFERIIIMPSQF